MWWTGKVTAVVNSDQMGTSLSPGPPNGATRGETLNLHQSASGCSAVWARAPVCAVLSGPAHNGVPLFHLSCFILPTEGNGSTSSAHMASHSCSVSFNLSRRGWAWGTGHRLLWMLLTGNSGVLSALQGPHMQRKTANNLPSYFRCYRGLLFLLLLTLSSLLSVLRKFTAIYVLMSSLCVAMVIYSSLWSFSRRNEFTVATLIYTTRQSNGLVGSVARKGRMERDRCSLTFNLYSISQVVLMCLLTCILTLASSFFRSWTWLIMIQKQTWIMWVTARESLLWHKSECLEVAEWIQTDPLLC